MNWMVMTTQQNLCHVGQRIMATPHLQVRSHACQVHSFTINVHDRQQLNYDIMKQNVLSELTDPLDKRLTEVKNPHFFTRNPTTKQIKVVPRSKQYGLVFDKRVINPEIIISYPYGYIQVTDEDEQICWNCKQKAMCNSLTNVWSIFTVAILDLKIQYKLLFCS